MGRRRGWILGILLGLLGSWQMGHAAEVKPRQNIVYLSAELNRLCWIRVSTDISIRDLSSVGGLIVPLYSVVAHRNATLWVQSI